MILRPFAFRLTLGLAVVLASLAHTLQIQAAPVTRWRDLTANCLDTLLTYGTDRYGSVRSDMLVAILDVNTHDSPQSPLWLDSEAYYEDRPHRRAMAGANFWHDQNTIAAMYRLSSMTGDAHYAAGADRTINAFFDNAIRADTGMPAWGSHTYYNVFTDQRDGDPNGQHEILVNDAQWGRLYAQRPVQTKAVVDLIWNRHVADKSTGQFNRHDDGAIGCDFTSAGGSFISAFAAMYKETKDPLYLNRALTVENWHWSHRNPVTNLVADAPGLATNPVQFEGNHAMTSGTGPYAWQLMNAYQQTGNATFLNHAVSYLKAYDHYGWDAAAGTYWGMLELNGTPVPEDPNATGYLAWAPSGHVDMWKTSIFSECPLESAQSTIRAYELTGDTDLLAAATHWAGAIAQELPVKLGRRRADEMLTAMPQWSETGGSYADAYGKTISFFVHMYGATDDASYLSLAEQVAQDAVDKLYVNDIFRGHPAKPYYESTNGVGFLLDALLELDAVSNVQPAVPEPSSIVLVANGLVVALLYAWRKRR